MDKPALDLLFLPDDFKIQIFKKLDWRSLKNLKLVCKNFCLLIEKNTQSLDRPKVYSLAIVHDGIKISKVEYKFIFTEDTWGSTNSKVIEFGNDDEYEKFLKNINFTKIKQLRLKNLLNKECISVRDNSKFGSDFRTYTFSAKLPNGRYCGEYLSIKIKNNKKFGILYDGSILRMDSLRKLGLFERYGSYSVGKKIAMDLLTGNPMLEYDNVPTGTHKLLYAQIMDHLFGLGFFSLENTCGCKRFKLLFREVSKFNVSRQKLYRTFFDQKRFNNKLVEVNNHNVFSIKSSMNCSKCGIEHENSIVYRKNSEKLCIQSL
uniref:F-box domain-containing protein n=1 Tax=Strongyloides papillosus TaxID=174720 RepID=A0A0N5BUW2_STREA